MKLLIENTKTFLEQDKNDKNDKSNERNENIKKLVPLAMKWLEKKFPKKTHGFTFKYKENLHAENMKSYNVSQDGQEFIITGKAFDTNSNGTKDTVVFRIDLIEEPEEKEPVF